MNRVDIITETLWKAFEQQVCVDRSLNRICDTGDHAFDMEEIAKSVIHTLEYSRFIFTVEQLHAIDPGTNELAGPVIKALGATGMGEIYEQNTDGTWGILCTPGTTGSWDERALDPQDIALPALLLWTPA